MVAKQGNKIRLLQVTHDLAFGGLQKVVLNLCKNIDRDRFDVSVLCLRALGAYAEDVERLGIKVFMLPQPSNGTDYLSFIKAAEIFRREKVEIIHTHNTQPLIDGTIARMLSGVKRIVHTDHGRVFPDKKRYMVAERFASNFVSKFVAVSQSTADKLIKFEKIPPHKITVIENGIDELKYQDQAVLAETKSSFGLMGEGPVIGFISRLSPEKGGAVLLDAMPLVLRAFPEAQLVIAGEGPQRESLMAQVEKLGLERNICWLGPRRDVPAILKAIDLYVLPSISEGLPMGLLEAIAAGSPVVATNVGGVPSVIKDKFNGELVPKGDTVALSQRIVSVLSDAALAERYVQNSFDTVLGKYTASNMTRRYQELYLA